MLTRKELVPSGRSPRNTPRAAKRKLQEQEGGGREGRKSAARLPRMELDQRLDALKVGLAQDSKLDRQFEARRVASNLQAGGRPPPLIPYLAVESECKS